MKGTIIAAVAASAAFSNALSVPQAISNIVGSLPFVQSPSGVVDLSEDEGLRLLELADGVREWHTESEKWALRRDGKRFMDVTDFSRHYDEGAVAVKAESAADKVTFPESLSHEKAVQHLAKNISQDNLKDTLTEFSSFHTRYYKSDSGLESSLWLFKQISAIAEGRDDVTVELFDHDWKQKSIIAHIEGTKRPDDIVIVGAHQDSVNLLMPSLLAAPGADDDGSGTVTTLEVFRVLIEHGFQPENSVEFQWYSAEEGGLLGSQDIFTKYAADEKVVKSMLQQDMTGFSKGSIDKYGHDSLGVIVDFVDEGLTEFIKTVVDNYCDIPYVETKCGYACSDHASAAKVGYPSAFVIESEFGVSSPYIHSTLDTVDRLDFDHVEQHAKLTLGYAYELGNHRF